ncbi:MAG: hypothetical protein PHW95_02475 [Patescibacteria group bacterium]|nr:hypothetical protein [Patescibacteria group bacterium]
MSSPETTTLIAGSGRDGDDARIRLYNVIEGLKLIFSGLNNFHIPNFLDNVTP